ncbi:hypothetical protein MFIFM68171_04288 [Madurella fahalii]|uniref:Uncharacterized protein n=1 Tax=Madurella fahalii TaxID=1157608 RepID=A0ABQ0G8I3_9PEZI
MQITTARLSITAAVSAPLAASLLVAPDSPCSKFCGNVLSSTAADEMVCDSGALANTGKGLVWEQCVDCLLTSTHVSGNQTDLQWLLYNLRFNMGYCLFDSPTDSPCKTRTACGELEDAIKYQNFTPAVGVYDYCKNWEQDFVPKCSPCLEVLEDGHYLVNYMMILEAACEQKPSPGSTVSIQGDPFGTDTVVIVEPQPTYATVPSPDYGPVSLGARVAIAFGAFAFILAIIGYCIVCNGKRKRRAFLRNLQHHHGGPHPSSRYGGGGGGDMFDTPVSQKPLRGWGNESPITAYAESPYTRYFSPYSSQYNSPVSGPESAGPSPVNWPALTTQQQLDQLVSQRQSPVQSSSPRVFTRWPTAGQEKSLMQMQAEFDKQQNEIATRAAPGGDEAGLRSKVWKLDHNGYPIDVKGKGRDEVYEVESPNGNNGHNDTVGRQDVHRMPTEPQAPVLHHPGYGRHHGSRHGTGGTGGAAALG